MQMTQVLSTQFDNPVTETSWVEYIIVFYIQWKAILLL